MFKTGLSTTGKEINPELFEKYAKAGIAAMEISVPAEKYDTMDYKALKENSEKTGVKLWAFHLPFKPFATLDISSSDKELRAHSVSYTAELIKKASDIGIDKYIVHSGGVLKRESQNEIDERMKNAKESYAALAEIAAKAGGTVAVENLPPVCVGKDKHEVSELISADDRLRVCFDTNHLLPGDPVDFIRHFKDKIITIHVSDYDFINERHWLPGEGKADFYKIYDALKEVGYSGIWLYEIGFVNGVTIERERALTCEDFVKNAKEIFEHKPISLIPSKKLCY